MVAGSSSLVSLNKAKPPSPWRRKVGAPGPGVPGGWAHTRVGGQFGGGARGRGAAPRAQTARPVKSLKPPPPARPGTGPSRVPDPRIDRDGLAAEREAALDDRL